jgi:hypothetical protein
MRSSGVRVPPQLYAAVLVAFATACAGSATQTRPKAADHSPASLYPLGAGYAWSYDVETPGESPVLAIARVTSVANGVATVVTGPEASQRYALSDLGIQRVGQPGYLLKAPIANGATWESGLGTIARVASMSEEVKTEAGIFSACVRVDERNATSGQHVQTTYCPGVGPALVVSEMEVRGQTLQVTARLRGYSLETEAAP